MGERENLQWIVNDLQILFDMMCNFVFGYAGKISYDIKIHLFKVGFKLEYKQYIFMLAFIPNVTNALQILLKFPRNPCNNKNAADRGQGPPNSTPSEIADIE